MSLSSHDNTEPGEQTKDQQDRVHHQEYSLVTLVVVLVRHKSQTALSLTITCDGHYQPGTKQRPKEHDSVNDHSDEFVRNEDGKHPTKHDREKSITE